MLTAYSKWHRHASTTGDEFSEGVMAESDGEKGLQDGGVLAVAQGDEVPPRRRRRF
jgi:hypothetical protein